MPAKKSPLPMITAAIAALHALAAERVGERAWAACVAEDHAAQKETVYGARVLPGDAAAFARAICAVAADRQRLGVQARAGIESRHSLTAASATLARELGTLL